MPTTLLLILLLTVATYASVWNDKTDVAWHSESETEFTITTAEQLAGLAELVNGGNNFEGKTVKLGANIMLNDTINWQNWASSPPANEWVPIGKKNYGKRIDGGGGRVEPDTIYSFNGIFDGNGFTVSGVYINSTKTYMGLFGHIGSNGTIKKLGVVASYIKGKHTIGGLVGASQGMISDSYFTGTMIGGEVGGLAGINDKGIISNCHSFGNITGQKSGGLAGLNFGKIINSHSSGKITGSNEIGGLAGRNTDTIISSHFSGEVIGERREIGGLVGHNFGKIVSSYSAGKVTGDEEVGGLVGSNGVSSSNGFIINSYSSSNVTARQRSAGGLVGIHNKGIISNSYSSGDVTSSGSGGGLVGDNKDLIVNSYSIGTAISTGRAIVKGLVGINADKGIVINCYYMLSDRHDKQISKAKTQMQA